MAESIQRMALKIVHPFNSYSEVWCQLILINYVKGEVFVEGMKNSPTEHPLTLLCHKPEIVNDWNIIKIWVNQIQTA